MPYLHLKSLFLTLSALLLVAPCASAQQAQAAFALHDGDRVVFYGDSITEQRLYTTFVEEYIVTHFPHLHISFVHSGWGGDTVRGGGGGPIDARLQRDVIAYKPTVVTIMLGMNDGGYHAGDQPTFDAYSKGYVHIVDTLRSALPGVRLTLIQPSPYDDVTQTPGFEGGYNGVLVQYGQYVKGLAAQDNLGIADLNSPVVAVLQKANATDPTTAQQIIPGRVHPSPAGHLIMAESLLKAWNAPSVVADVQIDAVSKKLIHAENSHVSDLSTGSKITWTQTDDALPMPLQWNDPAVALVLKSSDFTDALDREMLTVNSLPTATQYALKIDGQDVGEFTGEQLGAGINLAPLSTPMSEQAAKVAALTTQHNDQHFTRWRTIQVPLLQDANRSVQKALPPLLAALDSEEAETVTKQHAAAQPAAHHFEISPALPDPTGPNLALNKPYTTNAPNRYGYGMNALTDGSWTTDGQHTFATDDTDTFPKTATVDLGAATTLGAIKVGVPPFGSTETVQVSVSTDNQKFTPVGSYVFSQLHEEKHVYKFAAIQARYVRLTYSDHYAAEAGFSNKFAFTTEVEAYAPGP